MIKVDFHTHTHYSYDCMMRSEKILQIAKNKGLTHIVINDHNTINGGLECQALESKYGITVIVGSEIKTDIGDVTGLFLTKEIEPGPYLEVLKKIKDQKGVSILNHPYVGHKLEGLDVAAFDLIEGYNGRCSPEQNKKAIELALKHNKPFISGSDAHTYSEVGNNFTTFNSIDELMQPKEHVYKKTHNFYKVYSQFTKAFKKRDLKLLVNVFLGAPKKIILNK